MDVVILPNIGVISVLSLLKEDSMKKRYYVAFSSDKMTTSGYVRLTEDEARAVRYASNPDNWEDIHRKFESGSFYISDTPEEG